VNRGERALKRALAALAGKPEHWARVVNSLPITEQRTLDEFWPAWAHDGQEVPDAARSRTAPAFAGAQAAAGLPTWLIMAGRGFGKTRAGAEWVSALARRLGPIRIALVGATIEDALGVMVTGRSGLIAVARTGEKVVLNRSQRVVRFSSGAEAFLYSGACPEKLRGPEHHFAWCDEIAKWRHAEAAWDNLQLGLRLGEAPMSLVTTTPKASSALLRRLAEGAEAAGLLTGGRTRDNLNLPGSFVAGMEAAYGGTRKGREELDGELLGEAEGALWTRDLLEACRMILPDDPVRTAPGSPQPVRGTGDRIMGRGTAEGGGGGSVQVSEPPPSAPRAATSPSRGGFVRIVIGVDPPASAEGDACGIVACGVDDAGIGYVLADHTVSGLSPEGWASAVVAAARTWGAECVIVEKNQGGDMVKSVLHAADRTLPVRDVFARFGKGDRAEPVAMLFEAKRVRIAGRFDALEDELCAMVRGKGWAGPGRSPDRADAMVWALTELLLGRERVAPRIRGF